MSCSTLYFIVICATILWIASIVEDLHIDWGFHLPKHQALDTSGQRQGRHTSPWLHPPSSVEFSCHRSALPIAIRSCSVFSEYTGYEVPEKVQSLHSSHATIPRSSKPFQAQDLFWISPSQQLTGEHFSDAKIDPARPHRSRRPRRERNN